MPSYPTCPSMKSGKPEQGETRTLSNGAFQHKCGITGNWRAAVRLSDVRGALIANAALQGSYTYERGVGKELHNETAFLATDKDYGGDFASRPPELKQLGLKAGQHKQKPQEVKKYLGRVLLDPYDHPIRDFPELPATLSTEMKGWEVEYYLRKNLAIRPYDLMALCVSKFSDAHGRLHEGPPRIASLTEKATKFRRRAGLPSLKSKPGTESITNYIKSLLPVGAETIEGLKGDLTAEQVKASRKNNAGKYPNRRRKNKRTGTEKVEDDQKTQRGRQNSQNVADVSSAMMPPMVGPGHAAAGNGVFPMGPAVSHSQTLKRGVSQILPDEEADLHTRPSKLRKPNTAANDTKSPKRKSRKARSTSSDCNFPQQPRLVMEVGSPESSRPAAHYLHPLNPTSHRQAVSELANWPLTQHSPSPYLGTSSSQMIPVYDDASLVHHHQHTYSAIHRGLNLPGSTGFPVSDASLRDPYPNSTMHQPAMPSSYCATDDIQGRGSTQPLFNGPNAGQSGGQQYDFGTPIIQPNVRRPQHADYTQGFPPTTEYNDANLKFDMPAHNDDIDPRTVKHTSLDRALIGNDDLNFNIHDIAYPLAPYPAATKQLTVPSASPDFISHVNQGVPRLRLAGGPFPMEVLRDLPGTVGSGPYGIQYSDVYQG